MSDNKLWKPGEPASKREAEALAHWKNSGSPTYAAFMGVPWVRLKYLDNHGQFSAKSNIIDRATLPTDASVRKNLPIATGFLDYFPDAVAAVAAVSKRGNDKHNPGEPLHWAREKSNDHPDCAMRHFLERGGFDTDGDRHSAKAAWRMMAILQLEIEENRANAQLDLDTEGTGGQDGG